MRQKEVEIPDSAVGSRLYVKELALELVDAWKQESYQYVFETLHASPFALAVAVYHLLPYPSDKEKFLVRAINECKHSWPIENYKF